MDRTVCPECGARLAEGSERCDLCGAPQKSEFPPGGGTPESSPTSQVRDDIPEPSTEPEDTVCDRCGWNNPPGAKFCSDCGARLQGVIGTRRLETRPTDSGSRLPPPPSSRRPSDRDDDGRSSSQPDGAGALTRHVAVLVGMAVMVVVALYMVTVISKQRPATQAGNSVEVPAESRAARLIRTHEAIPIAAPYRERVDSIRSVIDASETQPAVEATHRLVDFLTDIGRVDRGAIEQMRLARRTDATYEWKSAGRLLLDWMERSDPETKPEVALLAIEAFKQVLEKKPDDLEARADLGWAYQYDPQNPMEAIRQTNLVLEADADHLMANYNKGVFLMRINRFEQALVQFERVKEIAGVDSPYHQQAQAWIDTIREAQAEREAS